MRLISPRRRFTLLTAFLAAMLNVLAPVLAYAVTQPQVHHHAVADMDAMHHDAHSMHHHAHPMRHGAHQDAPAAPHCPYCPDFASGAALAPTLWPPLVARADAIAYSGSVPARPASRSSLRLGSPRAPPLAD